jgi:hypothetical protein
LESSHTWLGQLSDEQYAAPGSFAQHVSSPTLQKLSPQLSQFDDKPAEVQAPPSQTPPKVSPQDCFDIQVLSLHSWTDFWSGLQRFA